MYYRCHSPFCLLFRPGTSISLCQVTFIHPIASPDCWATTALVPFVFPSLFGGWAALGSLENLAHVPFIFFLRTTIYCLSQFDRTLHQLKKSQRLLFWMMAWRVCLRAQAASSASLTGMPLKTWWPAWRTRASLSTGPWTCKPERHSASTWRPATQWWSSARFCGFKGEKRWRKQCEFTTCKHLITWIRHLRGKINISQLFCLQGKRVNYSHIICFCIWLIIFRHNFLNDEINSTFQAKLIFELLSIKIYLASSFISWVLRNNLMWVSLIKKKKFFHWGEEDHSLTWDTL